LLFDGLSLRNTRSVFDFVDGLLDSSCPLTGDELGCRLGLVVIGREEAKYRWHTIFVA
jgi:hypothetical protein